ncbi:hypothetical protein BCR39DRAFT_525856 [Naematelia encephala]|uniref:Uncharacterized protein n=1 Tax=Naematelia encephala TaxID=71784 RepID=A0A1Y2BAT7_9TREE|nr:hypothetical protein BCR39DRAFT_525856 [Naematelia encephala]
MSDEPLGQVSGFASIKVQPGQMVNVTFGGIPPFNVTNTVHNHSTDTAYCGLELFVLHTNTFSWQVEPYLWNDTGPGNISNITDTPKYIRNVGDSVIFSANQLTPVASGKYNYYASANYSIVNDSSVDSGAHPAIGTDLVGSCTLWVVLVMSLWSGIWR